MAPVGQYLRYSTVFDEQANLRVLALAAALASTKPEGVREIYPGYGSVYVEWDDARLSNDRTASTIASACSSEDSATAVLSAPCGLTWCSVAPAARTKAYIAPTW